MDEGIVSTLGLDDKVAVTLELAEEEGRAPADRMVAASRNKIAARSYSAFHDIVSSFWREM